MGSLKENIQSFINSRTPREKKMLIILVAGLVLFVDYWAFILPVTFFSQKTFPRLVAVKEEARSLREDRKNKAQIEKSWEDLKKEMEVLEKGLIARDEIPGLLESLSKEAQKAGLKITSLKPLEINGSDQGLYVKIPIAIHAIAGSHELGSFLERLEGGMTFFRIRDLHIQGNPADVKRHLVEMQLEAFQRKEVAA